MHLPLQRFNLLGEDQGLPGQPPIVMPHCPILTFYEGDIDMSADMGAQKIIRQGIFCPEDYLCPDTDNSTLAPILDHLSVEQTGRRFKTRLGKTTSLPLPLRLKLLSKGFQNSLLILRPLITEEDVQGTVVYLNCPLDQSIGILLGDLPNYEGGDDLVDRIEAQPTPLVAIDLLKLLEGGTIRLFFFTKLQNSSN